MEERRGGRRGLKPYLCDPAGEAAFIDPKVATSRSASIDTAKPRNHPFSKNPL